MSGLTNDYVERFTGEMDAAVVQAGGCCLLLLYFSKQRNTSQIYLPLPHSSTSLPHEHQSPSHLSNSEHRHLLAHLPNLTNAHTKRVVHLPPSLTRSRIAALALANHAPQLAKGASTRCTAVEPQRIAQALGCTICVNSGT
jgi:hypothetical protein